MKKQKHHMKRRFLLAMLLSCLGLTAQAQSIHDVNLDGKVDVEDVTKIVDVIMKNSSDASVPAEEEAILEPRGHNTVTIWKDGVPTIIPMPDRVVLWNDYNSVPDEPNQDNGSSVEPTEAEQAIIQLTSDEESAPKTNYTEEEFSEYDQVAQDLIASFAGAESKTRKASTRGLEEDLAEAAIRNNGRNIFPDVIVEQLDWDSGLWGKTRYAGKQEGKREAAFETFYTTFWKNGLRCIEVVFYHKGGFPNDQKIYLKLGQANSGKILDHDEIPAGKEYGFITICIENYLPGFANFFPVMITKGSEARYYLNPICVKSDPIVPKDWAEMTYGQTFGKINGVNVYCNSLMDGNGNIAISSKTGKPCKNIYGNTFQCVELCKRYVKNLNANISRGLKDAWGNAINWPAKRASDDKDPGRYIVYRNNGETQVREGDLIVWDYGDYGHIGVVIKTTDKYISVAHQNGGSGSNARPIGSTLKLENGIVKDIMPGSNKSSIFASSKPINYLIRINHPAEQMESLSAALSASTTQLDFGKTEAGKSVSKTFTITNSGYDDLTISSITASSKDFSINPSSCTIGHGETKTFTVTYSPTRSGNISDKLVIESNAKDNPTWTITLSGIGYGGAAPADIPTEGLVAYYPFNGNANDESGNGNHGTVIGNVKLTTDRHGNSNGAYQFFGNALNYISVPDHASLHISKFTLSAWVYTDSDNYGSGYLINKGRDIENGSYRLCVTSVGAQTCYSGSNGVSMPKPETGVWHMVTGTVEGNKARIYLDGKFVAEKNLSYSFVHNNSEKLTLGMHYYSGVPDFWAYPLLGIMDDVRIYNRVLSDSEIEALYTE